MPNLTDKDVASLLKSEATQRATLTQRRPGNGGPKPNTQFLQHLLRETDSHNAALLAKEKREAQARQQGLRHKGRDSRHDGDERSSKRRRIDDRDRDGHSGKKRRNRSRSRSRSKSPKSLRRHRDRSEERRKHRRRDSRDNNEHREHRAGRRKQRDRSNERGGRRDRSSSFDHRRGRDRSDSEHSERGKRNHKRKENHRGVPAAQTSSKEKQKEAEGRNGVAKKTNGNHSDSDPLEDLVGPLPPPSVPEPTRRGRGTFSQATSTIDAHFNPTYDPSQDVHPNSDREDDWEQALEALRDREKWKRQGAERLRAAGFSDDQVQKWEKTTLSKARGEADFEGDVNDVKWAKKGEGREWDRGKVVDVDDGSVGVETNWGRLKNT